MFFLPCFFSILNFIYLIPWIALQLVLQGFSVHRSGRNAPFLPLFDLPQIAVTRRNLDKTKDGYCNNRLLSAVSLLAQACRCLSGAVWVLVSIYPSDLLPQVRRCFIDAQLLSGYLVSVLPLYAVVRFLVCRFRLSVRIP